MEFRIADTFTDSLARLTGDEQKAVKTTAFDLQMNPASPGLSFHRLDNVKDKNFWSVRVSSDIRIIVHKSESSLLLCYVDHHDSAYQWAGRRKLETHPKTGAAQLVEIRETVKEIMVPRYVEETIEIPVAPKSKLFDGVADDVLLSYGVPEEWLADVRDCDEDTLLVLADHLPSEAAEALLEHATGGTPYIAPPLEPHQDPFEHPDAQRRFRIMSNREELERAFAFPWDKWLIFLHPDQQVLVEKHYSGPARVTGSAGTGKTIVALHRAVHLAKHNENARVLLATFSKALAKNLDSRLKRLVRSEPRLADQIEVHSMDDLGLRLYRARIGKIKLAEPDDISRWIAESAAKEQGHKFSRTFLISEWVHVVDAWQLDSWEAYRDVPRLGRKIRLPESQREVLWRIYSVVIEALRSEGLSTRAQMFTELAENLSAAPAQPYDFTVIDEAQDLSVAQLKFLAELGKERSNALFFAGDIGQRIFQQPFSWLALGIDIRGRSKTLRVNYRTSHQIKGQADRLLEPQLTDADGNEELRRGTVSVFNGPSPSVTRFDDEEAESAGVAEWLTQRLKSGAEPHEIGMFVRSEAQMNRAISAAESVNRPYRVLDEHNEPEEGFLSLGTMHIAKGLEFKAVVVMACDDEVVPLQERIDTAGDDADLKEVYDTERHLLYVACTRAREHLLLTCVEPGSEFLEDMFAG